MQASSLDPSGWADVRAWLSKEENVSRLLADWEQEDASPGKSLASRLNAADDQIAALGARIANKHKFAELVDDDQERAELAAEVSELRAQVRAKALDARVTIWRADYVHPDDWPQRYRIVLHFTGFTGQPVTLPAHPNSVNW